MASDEHSLSIDAADGVDRHTCPTCETPVDTDEWSLQTHAGDAWGGTAMYDCPTDGCPGTLTITY